jgi:hypothetical protein
MKGLFVLLCLFALPYKALAANSTTTSKILKDPQIRGLYTGSAKKYYKCDALDKKTVELACADADSESCEFSVSYGCNKRNEDCGEVELVIIKGVYESDTIYLHNVDVGTAIPFVDDRCG